MQRPPAAEVESSRTPFQVTPLPQLLTIPSFFNEQQATFLTNLFHGLKKPAATLRPHQLSALNEYCQGLMQGSLHAVVAMVMGSGKTVLAAHLILNGLCGLDGKPSGRVLITTSKINLVAQIKNEIETHCGEQLNVVLFDANKSDWRTANVIVATDAALKIPFNRALLLSEVQMLIMDEAHKSLGEAGVAMAKDFIQAGCLVLPMTATPINDMKNQDEKENGVKSCYELIGVTPDTNSVKPFGLIAAVEMGMLAPVSSGIIQPDLDAVTRAQLENQREEMQEEKLGRLINQPALNNLAVDIYANGTDPDTKTRFFGKQAIVFCGGVNHAEDMAYAFNQHLPADHERIRQARDLYLRNAQRRAIENRQPFDRQAASAAFKVAQAIHAGEYKVSIAYEKIAAALEANCIEFLNPRTGRLQTHCLSTKDREQLLTKQSLNKSGHLAVLAKLNKAEKKAILEKIEDGGILVVTGADMLIEGANYPDVSLLLAPRGTASLTLEAQRSGRVLRKRAGKRACIIEFDLNLPKQVFFFDLTAGKMALGAQDQADVRFYDDLDVIPIPNVAKASGIEWSEKAISRIKLKSLRERCFFSPDESENPAPTNATDEVSTKVLQVLDELAQKLTELEAVNASVEPPTPNPVLANGDITEIDEAASDADEETEVEKVRRKPRLIPEKTMPVITPSAGLSTLQAANFIKMHERGAKLIKRIEKISANLHALIEDEESAQNIAQKRRRAQAEQEQGVTVQKISPSSQLISAKVALETINKLRQQMIQLLAGGADQPEPLQKERSERPLTATVDRQTDDLAALMEKFSAILTSLEEAKRVLSSENLVNVPDLRERQRKVHLTPSPQLELSMAEPSVVAAEQANSDQQDVEMIPAAAELSVAADLMRENLINAPYDSLMEAQAELQPVLGGDQDVTVAPGFGMNEIEAEGNVDLHHAQLYIRDMVKTLLDKFRSINAKDNNGNTPLHVCLQNPQIELAIKCIPLLIEKGADTTAINKAGQTPLMVFMQGLSRSNLCFDWDSEDANTTFSKIKLLFKSDNRLLLNRQDFMGRTVLHYVVVNLAWTKNNNKRHAYLIMFRKFYNLGANPLIQDIYRKTPFDLARALDLQGWFLLELEKIEQEKITNSSSVPSVSLFAPSPTPAPHSPTPAPPPTRPFKQ